MRIPDKGSCCLKGRLKSLHSVWKKMQRKKASLEEVYDARALRIVVGDEDGKRHKVSPSTSHCLLPVEINTRENRIGSF